MFGPKPRNSSKVCFKYNDIPLRTFLEVAENRQYRLLVKAGNFTEEELMEEWESIIEVNSDLTGQMEFSTYKDLLIGYGQLVAQYNIDKGLLMKLCFQVDDAAIEELRERGYIIDTAGAAVYAQTLADALIRSNNLVTRIEMKQKELERFHDSVNVERKVTYEELVAQLNAALGFSVNDNITLAAFNEYQKILKRRNTKANRPE